MPNDRQNLDLFEKQDDEDFWSAFFRLEKLAQMPLDDDEALVIVAKDPKTGDKNTYRGVRLKKNQRRRV